MVRSFFWKGFQMSDSNAPPRPIPQKEVGIAYLFWFFLGVVGGHKFYLGRTAIGIAYLFTLGFLLVGFFIDLFTLPGQVRKANEALYEEATK
jgi:TM2 domain-containing membrane protein YozV